MLVYLIEYVGGSSMPEASVVLANSEEEALSLADEDSTVTNIEQVHTDSREGPQVVYTGTCCC